MLKLYPYSKKLKPLFQKQKKELLKILGEHEIQHVGSTAITGIKGKGIIDIIIAIDSWKNEKEIVAQLKKIGFTHIHERENGRRFISKAPPSEYGDTHIHLVKKSNKAYKELLFFRDYLNKNKKAAQEYELQKIQAINKAQRNRPEYKRIKENYIKLTLRKEEKEPFK